MMTLATQGSRLAVQQTSHTDFGIVTENLHSNKCHSGGYLIIPAVCCPSCNLSVLLFAAFPI